MEQTNIEDEENALRVLVENILYKQVESNENELIGKKGESREAIIKSFLKEYRARFKSMSDEQYIEIVKNTLERTEKNIKKLRRDYQDKEEDR